MRRLPPLALLLALLAAPAAGAERLLAIDFASAAVPASASGPGTFAGVLPDGCTQDFAGWNASVARSATGSGPNGGFLRLTVERIDRSVQFRMPVAGIRLPGRFRLGLRLRLHDSAALVALRQIPTPYATLWSAPVSGSPGAWREHSFAFAIDRDSAVPVGILLYPGAGACDLGRLVLDQLSEEEFAATVRRPGRDGGSLLGARHFPLGLPSGWSVGSDATAAWADAAPDATAPSGLAPLRFAAPQAATLYSAPFQVHDPRAGHLAQLSCRATGSWAVQIAGRSTILAEHRVPVGDGWQRLSIPFGIPAGERLAPGFHLRFRGHGELLLDDLAIAADGAPVADVPEVALALADGELAELRTAFDDEPAAIAIAVAGDCPGALLRLRVEDPWGGVRDLPGLRVESLHLADRPGLPLRTGRIDAGAGTAAPLGQFRWQAWLERDGRRLGPAAEMLATRIRRPRTAGRDAPDSPFGIHVAPARRQVALARAAGATWARFHDALQPTAWAVIEPEPGRWAFRDAEIQLFRDRHFLVYAGLSTAPRWASAYAASGKPDVHPYFDQYFQPRDLEAWRRYAAAVAARYRGRIGAYFLWNEPWGRDFWHVGWDAARREYTAGATPERDYAALCAIAYRAAKEADPSATIVGFNTAGGAWTRGVLAAGAWDSCDAVDYHYYSTAEHLVPGDPAEAAFRAAIGPIRELHPDARRPVFMSEGQGNSDGLLGMEARTGMHRLVLPWESAEDPLLTADRTCRFVVANLAAGADKVFLYSMHGYRSLLSGPGLGVLVGADGFPHLELAAYSSLAWQIEGRRWRRRLDLGDGALAHLFADGTGTTAVVAGRRGARPAIEVPAGATAYDLFGNPRRSPLPAAGCLWYIRSKQDPDALALQLAATPTSPPPAGGSPCGIAPSP